VKTVRQYSGVPPQAPEPKAENPIKELNGAPARPGLETLPGTLFESALRVTPEECFPMTTIHAQTVLFMPRTLSYSAKSFGSMCSQRYLVREAFRARAAIAAVSCRSSIRRQIASA